MMKKKMHVWMIILMLLYLASPVGTAASPKQNENIASKEETVYAKLTPAGTPNAMYLVNIFDVKKAGPVIDYGEYTTVKNLTDETKIEKEQDKVQFSPEKGRFYYQGNKTEVILPWRFSFVYFLDGKKIEPEQLIGKSGHVTIRLDVTKNERVKENTFFENYVVQMSLTLDSEKFTQLKAEEATIANAGGNKQITFTIMPEKEAHVEVKANVSDFSMEGISISAVPFAMHMEALNTDEMTEKMHTLHEAIAAIHHGTGELLDGAGKLRAGANDLQSGSSDFKKGLDQLNGSSAQLVAGSAEINDALGSLDNVLLVLDELDTEEIALLMDALENVPADFKATTETLVAMRDNVNQAGNALGVAIADIPDAELTDSDIDELYESGADPDVIDQLLLSYAAAQTVKEVYQNNRESMDDASAAFDEAIQLLEEVEDHIATLPQFSGSEIGEDLNSLRQEIGAFTAGYQAFHNGLITYTNGVGKLADSYGALHHGIEGVADGLVELDQGAASLYSGTGKLYEATRDMPKEMTNEIDEMLAAYDKSDFEAVSFASHKNGKVDLVQFIIKTDPLEKEVESKEEAESGEKESFLERIKGLFDWIWKKT